jgi:hypothetical protein
VTPHTQPDKKVFCKEASAFCESKGKKLLIRPDYV